MPNVEARLTAVDYTALSKAELYFAFSLVTSLFFLWGLSYGLLDVLNKHFLEICNRTVGLTKTQSTLLQFAYFVSYLLVSPPMGMFMRKYGYKRGIHIGLGLFSIGAVLFWPSAKYEKYGMFVAFTFVAASGLATLETAANSYITVLGPPSHSAMRLTFAQAFNGIATVIGPIIASHTFFNGANQYSLDTVQYVYLALACFALLLNILTAFTKLPEVKQAVNLSQDEILGQQGLKRQYHLWFGVLAEFFYVGAQVAVASFTIFYITEQPGIYPPISSATASNMFSGCQAVFTFGRFLGVLYLKWIDPSFALFINGLGICLFTILTATVSGKGGIACLFLIFFFESVCYPVIFSVATADLGTYAKVGAGFVALGVSGGAVYPSMQGAVSDHVNTLRSFFIPLTGFVPLMLYGFVMWIVNSRKYSGQLTIWTRKTNVNIEENDEQIGSGATQRDTETSASFGDDEKETKVFKKAAQE
nr:L-fucose transporter [Cryptococcus depauperatus CBS 7855]